MALTCSGSDMSHSLVRRFSVAIAVSTVAWALPSFWSCHACAIMLSSLGTLLVVGC